MRKAILALLCISCVSVLTPAICAVPQPIHKVREFALPSIAGQPFRPRISGDWVVAVRNYEKRAENVLLINIADSNVYTLFNIADGRSIFPSINGNVVVWTGKSDQVESLYGKRRERGQFASSMILYDLPSGRYFAPDLKTNSAFFVSVFGRYVAYELGSRIYLYDITTGEQRRISDDNPWYHLPDISGDIIVWDQKTDASSKRQICAWQFSTGQQIQLTNDPDVDHIGPNTDGRYIVWWTKAGVDVYDTKNKSTFTVPTAYFPAVDRGVLVYQRREGAINPVFGMDLATHQEFRISSGTANIGPDIDAGRVIWCTSDTIYCAELSNKPGK